MKNFTSEDGINNNIVGKQVVEVLFLRDDNSNPEDRTPPSGANMALILDDGSRLIVEATEALVTLQIPTEE